MDVDNGDCDFLQAWVCASRPYFCFPCFSEDWVGHRAAPVLGDAGFQEASSCGTSVNHVVQATSLGGHFEQPRCPRDPNLGALRTTTLSEKHQSHLETRSHIFGQKVWIGANQISRPKPRVRPKSLGTSQTSGRDTKLVAPDAIMNM